MVSIHFSSTLHRLKLPPPHPSQLCNLKPSFLSKSNKSPNTRKKIGTRYRTCRAEFSNDAPFAAAIGACMLSSLVLPVTTPEDDGGGGSPMDSTDARFAVMGIVSFIPYFNWLVKNTFFFFLGCELLKFSFTCFKLFIDWVCCNFCWVGMNKFGRVGFLRFWIPGKGVMQCMRLSTWFPTSGFILVLLLLIECLHVLWQLNYLRAYCAYCFLFCGQWGKFVSYQSPTNYWAQWFVIVIILCRRFCICFDDLCM